jgi:hypothetical protein
MFCCQFISRLFFFSGENFAYTDLHALDLETFTWSSRLMSVRSPEALQGHKAVISGDSMYIIGGKVRGDSTVGSEYNSSGLSHQVYRYQFADNKWSVVETSGSRPAPRQLHAAVSIPREHGRTSIFQFGGTDKSKCFFFADMWELRDIRSQTASEATLPCSSCEASGLLVNNMLFSDTRFLVDGKIIHAHRCMLYTRSEYFRTMFAPQTGMRESTEAEIPIPNVTFDVMLNVLHWIYCGTVTINEGQLAVDLLRAADMFGLDSLRAQCVEKVEAAVTIENAAFICEVADRHHAEHLKHFCISFIIHNMKQVINSEAWVNLQSRDSSGLGREILNAFTDSAALNPQLLQRRPRTAWR